MSKEMIKCPICKGIGKLEGPLNIPKGLQQERVKIAKALREADFSIREIMKIMNYKSPLSIQKLLKQ